MNPYQAQIEFFIGEGERNWKTAISMFKTKHYDWCLFVGHLTLEKFLKALVILTTKQSAPYIHNLQDLAKRAGLMPTATQVADLGEITTFNIEIRYDTDRRAFYKKCTKAYARKWLKHINELRIWLVQELENRSGHS
ncbi:MAG: HEPN domain-containing protein [bacterium]|nr:HEPN domain-containing protein [bacterium]